MITTMINEYMCRENGYNARDTPGWSWSSFRYITAILKLTREIAP